MTCLLINWVGALGQRLGGPLVFHNFSWIDYLGGSDWELVRLVRGSSQVFSVSVNDLLKLDEIGKSQSLL